MKIVWKEMFGCKNDICTGNLIHLYIVGLLLTFVLMTFSTYQVLASNVVSPLQASGLIPIWEENFTDGGLDRFQYTWARGHQEAMTSFTIPGVMYLGHEKAPAPFPFAEQQINNFKVDPNESIPHTIEFDLFSPMVGDNRISLRPRRYRDFAHIKLGLNTSGRSLVQFVPNNKDPDNPPVWFDYEEKAGVGFGWAHIVASYRQYQQGETTYLHYVVAINNEVHEFQAPSGMIPDWVTDWTDNPDAMAWSIEYDSLSEQSMGKYIANIRGYAEYLNKTAMENRLAGRLEHYREGLPDPTTCNGPKKFFQVHKTLETKGPNAMIYATQSAPLTLKLDGSLSSDWRRITTYTWDFGDGSGGSGRLVHHTYAEPGNYSVKLTISSDSGAETHQICTVVNNRVALSLGHTAMYLTRARQIYILYPSSKGTMATRCPKCKTEILIHDKIFKRTNLH